MRSDETPVDLVTVGEALGLIATRDPGPWSMQRSAQLSFGGSESNVAIGASRLGHSVAWIGRRGDDGFGHMIGRELAAEGVRVSGPIDSESPTAVMLKERRTADSSRVQYHRTGSAGSRLSPGDLDERLIGDARIIHVSMITPAISETAGATTRAAFEHARASRTSTSLDLNYRRALWSVDRYREATLALLPLVDTVFASVEEILPVTQADSVIEAMRDITSRGPRTVVVTDGARGARYLSEGAEGSVEARRVTVLDTVGAGDAFVAGWLSAELDGADIALRSETAASCGAFACTVLGDWEGAPRRAELDAFATESDAVSR